MSSLSHDDVFEQLAAGYFDEVLDESEHARFVQMLREDDRRVQRFAELAQLHQMIESEIAYHHQAQRFGLSLTPSDSGAASAMVELASLDEDGTESPMDFAAWREEQASKAQAQRYSTFIKRAILGSAVAALFMLVGVLALVYTGGDSPAPQVAEQVVGEPDREEVSPLPSPVVATLTATHNAQWADDALAVGSGLRPHQSLTLTAGFVEITTARGAVAILESPCTIELTNSDNALRLHAGKLVGMCYTESSKGFVVKTDHADITDLGTEFGVEVSADDGTYAQVFDGVIEMVASEGASSSAPMRMGQGQASRVMPDSSVVLSASFEPTRFVRGEVFDALVGLRGDAARLTAAYWIRDRAAQHYNTGDAVVAIQAEDFQSIELLKGTRNPWEIKRLDNKGADAEDGQVTALYVGQGAGRKSGQANYNIRFRKPGVYYLYLRATFVSIGKDASYGDAIYRSAPGLGSPFMDAGKGLAEEERLRLSRWLESDALPVGRFAWWDPTDQTNPQTLHLAGINKPTRTVPRRYVVTEADLDKTHRFVLTVGEPGVAIDGFVFAQRDDLTPQELDRFLKSAQKPKQP